MGKTADLPVVQKTIIDTLHKEGKPHTFIAKEAGCSQSAVSKHVNRKLSGRKKCGRKRCTTNRENRSLVKIVKQNRFKNIGWASQGMDWGCVQGIKSHHTQTRNLATVVSQRHFTLAKEKNWTVAQWSKVLFSDERWASFVFNLETKVLESGGRAEKLIAQVAWSPVLSFHSLWWFGVQCYLLVLFNSVFWKPTSLLTDTVGPTMRTVGPLESRLCVLHSQADHAQTVYIPARDIARAGRNTQSITWSAFALIFLF